VQSKNELGKKVTYTLSRWETPDNHSGVVTIDASDGRRGLVPTAERLTFLLQEHGLDSNLQPPEPQPEQ
jgi:hypothetical protein